MLTTQLCILPKQSWISGRRCVMKDLDRFWIESWIRSRIGSDLRSDLGFDIGLDPSKQVNGVNVGPRRQERQGVLRNHYAWVCQRRRVLQEMLEQLYAQFPIHGWLWGIWRKSFISVCPLKTPLFSQDSIKTKFYIKLYFVSSLRPGLLCPVSAMSVFGNISKKGPDTFLHRKVHIY